MFSPRPAMMEPAPRPLRSMRLKPAKPFLPEIMARIGALNGKYYESIRSEFNAVTKYFKDNDDDITEFWLTHYAYDLTDFKHRYLARLLFERVGFYQPLVKVLLDKVGDKQLLRQMGVERFVRSDTEFYRICVGDCT